MTTCPNDYAERAAHSTFRAELAIREEAFFDSAVLMPSTYSAEG